MKKHNWESIEVKPASKDRWSNLLDQQYEFVSYLRSKLFVKKIRIEELESKLLEKKLDYKRLIKKYDALAEKHELFVLDTKYPAKFKDGDRFDGIVIVSSHFEGEEEFLRRKAISRAVRLGGNLFSFFFGTKKELDLATDVELHRQRMYVYVDTLQGIPENRTASEKELEKMISIRLEKDPQ